MGKRLFKRLIGVVVMIIVLVGGYWFAVRPYYVRKACNHTVRQVNNTYWLNMNGNYQTLYQACLNSKGL